MGVALQPFGRSEKVVSRRWKTRLNKVSNLVVSISMLLQSSQVALVTLDLGRQIQTSAIEAAMESVQVNETDTEPVHERSIKSRDGSKSETSFARSTLVPSIASTQIEPRTGSYPETPIQADSGTISETPSFIQDGFYYPLRLQLPPSFPGFPSLSPSTIGPKRPIQATSIPLLANWNLISIPEEPADTDPAIVLASIDGDYTSVFAYDGCDGGDPWKQYDPADPVSSDLTAIDHKIGFWIEMAAPATLDVDGTIHSSTDISLCEGWNLIGYPLNQALPVAGALSSIEGKYSRVFTSDPTDAADPWQLFDPSVPEWVNDLQIMEPGRGYWILATEDVILTLSQDTTPPIVEIAAPLETAEVTSLTDVVGTASDPNLQEWFLEFAPAENRDQFTQLTSGSVSIVNGTLMQFDPSLLMNGIILLRLRAADFAGNTASITRTILVEGHDRFGSLRITYTDLEVPLSGIPIAIRRTYDSRNRGVSDDFGFGWTLEVGTATRYASNRKPGDGWEFTSGFLPCQSTNPTKSHVTEIRLTPRESYRFALEVDPLGIVTGGCTGTASFTQVGGVPGAKLQILGNTEVFWQNGTDQVITLDTFEVYEPENVRLTTLNGVEYDVKLGEGLTRIAEPNGNTISISPGGVSHSSGESINFGRDAQARIVSITDPKDQQFVYTYDGGGNLVTVTDPASDTTTFAYDSSHFLTSITDPLGHTLQAEFDAEGRAIALIDDAGNRRELNHDVVGNSSVIQDRLGNPTRYDYDDSGNLTKVTAPGGLVTEYVYHDNGYLQSETDPLGYVKEFTYNSNDNLETITDPLGNTTSYSYDAKGHILTMTQPGGAVTTHSYDATGNISSTSDALGNLTTFTYDSRGNLLTETDPLGCATTKTYDSRGNLTSETDPLGNPTEYTYDANGQVLTKTVHRTVAGTLVDETTTYVYDAEGNVLTITDPLGKSTHFVYNANNQVVSETDPLGRTINFSYNSESDLMSKTYPDGTSETFSYDAESRPISQTDRSGRTTTFEYDANGRQTKIIFPDGTSQSFSYDAGSRLISMTDQRGFVTLYGYDGLHRQTSLTDPLGNVTAKGYDARGNLISATDALGRVTTYEYDLNNQLTKETFPDGTSLILSYDAAGRKVAETDQAGNTTQFEYDCLDRLTKVTDSLGQVTVYNYDEVGNLIASVDANGQTTSFNYDANGRLIKQVLPLGMEMTIVFDAVGNMLRKTDFNGNATDYSYDVNNRISQVNYYDLTSVSYSYTPTGELSSMTDSYGINNYTYAYPARLTSVTYPDGHAINYSYDAAGNRTGIASPSGSTTYAFDALNRLVKVTDPDSGETAYAYDAVGNPIQLTYSNGTRAQYTYDALNRLLLVQNARSDSSVINTYTYTLGPTGNRTQVIDDTGRRVEYTYDSLNRLTREQIFDPTSGDEDIVYTYDAVGNRLSRTDNTGTVGYTYDANDRVLTADGTTFTYDDNGNVTSRTVSGVTTTYSYDPENRLLRVDGPDPTVEFVYDGNGSRIGMSIGGIRTDYIVDNNRIFNQVLEERDESGSLLASYIYGDDLIRQQRSGNNSFYHYDGLGSTRALTDPTQVVTDTYVYDAFGVSLQQTGTTLNYFQFAGEQLDPEIGMYYLRARYYDQQVGRFITRDTVDGSLTNPQSRHKYVYAENNPVNRIDPSGRMSVSVTASMGMHATISATALMNYMSAVFAISTVVIAACAKAQALSSLLYMMDPYIVTYVTGPNNPCSHTRIPILYTRVTRMQFTALHITIAQLAGFDRVLHRVPSNDPNRTNARRMCRQVYGRYYSMGGLMACDEYPFATTFEWRNGFSVMVTPIWEQSRQGGEIISFYNRCGIQDYPAMNSVFGVVVVPSRYSHIKCN
jgi:RHS repeat-associated protein